MTWAHRISLLAVPAIIFFWSHCRQCTVDKNRWSKQNEVQVWRILTGYYNNVHHTALTGSLKTFGIVWTLPGLRWLFRAPLSTRHSMPSGWGYCKKKNVKESSLYMYSLRLQVDKVLCPQQPPPVVQHKISNPHLPDSVILLVWAEELIYPWVYGDYTYKAK